MPFHTRDRSARARRRRGDSLARLEALEARDLLTAGAGYIRRDASLGQIRDMVVTDDGTAWVSMNGAEPGTSGFVFFDPRGPDRPVPAITNLIHPSLVSLAPGGAIWIASEDPAGASILTRVQGSDRSVFPLPATPRGLASDLAGNLWVTVSATADTPSEVIRLTPNPNSRETLPIPSGAIELGGVATVADGSVWFAETSRGKIGRIAADGSVTEYAINTSPAKLIAAPDGSAWFTATTPDGKSALGRITPDGTYTGFLLGGASDATSLAFGDDGNLWFTDAGRDALGSVSPDGRISFTVLAHYDTPGADVIRPDVLVPNPRGGVYFGSNEGTAGVLGYVNSTSTPVDLGITAVSIGLHQMEGTLGDGITVATFTDTDSRAEASWFLARVDFGDQGAWPGIVSANDRGGFDVHLAPGFPAVAGSVPVTVTIFEGEAIGATTQEEATFDPAPIPTITAIFPTRPSQYQAQTTTAVVARFATSESWASAADFLATVTWGDGSARNPWGSAPAEITANEAGGFEVTADLAFAGWGTIPLTVMIATRKGLPEAQVVSTAIVTPATVAASGGLIGVSTSPLVQHVVVARFTSSDPLAEPSDYFATIDWGDGITTAGDVSSDASGRFFVSGDYEYGQPGTFRAIATIGSLAVDGSVAVVAASVSEVTVADETIEVTGLDVTGAVAKATWRGAVATFRQGPVPLDPSLYKATITWGDGGAPSRGTIREDGAGGFVVESSHYFAKGGQYGAVVRVERLDRDPAANPSAGEPFTISASDAPFLVEGKRLDAVTGSVVSGVVASFLDDSPHAPGDYSALVTWDDGSRSTGLVSSYGNGFVVFANHTYAAEGSYSYGVAITETGGWGGPKTSVASGVVTVKSPAPAPAPSDSDPVGGDTDPEPAPVPEASARLLSARSLLDRRGGAKVVLTFSSALGSVDLADVSRYRLTDAGKDRRFGTKDDRVLKIKAFSHDASNKTLTLSPRGTFRRRSPFRVSPPGQATVAASWVRGFAKAANR